jgi:L-fuculose-phosphate aldolase
MSLRLQLAEVARFLHAAGWVANHDGNATVRDGARYLATPTATSKRKIGERDLIELDPKGAVVGRGKVFGEIGLHLMVYERRPDVGCVVHAHPPAATAIACARGASPIEVPFIAEAVVSLGPRIPKLAYAQPGEPARAALAPWCELVDAVLLGNHGVLAWGADPEQALLRLELVDCVLLGNHGVLAWGADPEQAFLRLELVEHLAKIALAAQPLGGVDPLPAAALAPLLAARAKAGIGRAADRAVELADKLAVGGGTSGDAVRPVVACAPAPHSDVPTIYHGASASADAPPSRPGGARLGDIVREEIVRALR